MDRASPLLVLLTGGLLIVGACSGTSASVAPSAASAAPPAPTASAESTASPSSAAPSSAAPASAGAAGTLCAKEFDPCALPDGTYTTGFEFPFVVTVDGGDWSNERNWPHGGSLSKANKSAILWASGVDHGIVAEKETPIGPTVDDFIAHLRKFDGFTVSEPTPVTVDGVSGKQVDVLTNTTEASRVFFLPEDAFNVAAGEKIRFIVLDKDGKTVVLMIDAFDAKDFDAFLADVAQPMLDGWKWA
jgi:hypothetical protein